jgi:perosamine synthetase
VSIPLFRPSISEDAIRAVGDVLRSGWLGLGPRTEQFEHEFARYIGSPHCVGLNSCTSAIHLALHTLELPPGSEVITTALTFVSTNHAILYEGLVPVFADVDRTTGSLLPSSVKERISERTRAIVVVHYGGLPADIDELYEIAGESGLRVIEDCAHACGATYKGKRVGSHGDFHAFSFHAVKNLPMGDGGALTVSSAADDERLRRLRWLGIDKDTFRRTSPGAYDWEYDVPEVGFKYHMNDIQAAIGIEQLKLLDKENARRNEIARMYRHELEGADVVLPPLRADRESSYHLFPILVEERDELVKKLKMRGIGTGVHYRRNDEYPMYARADLPNAGYFASSEISLPMHMCLSDDDVGAVSRAIAEGW